MPNRSITGSLASLPPRQKIWANSPIHYYGASELLSRYSKVDRSSLQQISGIWQHGWISARRTIHPALVIGGTGSYEAQKESELFLVGRQDHAQLLRAAGYKKVEAIGLPVVYAPKTNVKRIPRTLLVMPVHSLAETTHAWPFEQYVAYIDSIRGQFDDVTISISKQCIEHGYWFPQFSERGYRIIEGASGADANALIRMKHVMQMHEFLTTNGYGSHLVYGAAFGAKVSVAGPYAVYRVEDFERTPLYRDVPGILAPTIVACSEAAVREDYPHLFTEPWNAVTSVEWGEFECGWNNKKTPAEIRELIGWRQPTLVESVRRRMTNILHSTRHLGSRAKKCLQSVSR